jgi:hypothetical protein
LANYNASTTLTVKLLKADGEPFKPSSDINIDLWTSKGDALEPITMPRNKLYVQTKFKTYKVGDVEITAHSPDYSLNSTIAVSFIRAITALTLFIAFMGGFFSGIAEHVLKKHENNKKTEEPNKEPEDIKKKQWNAIKEVISPDSMLSYYLMHGFFGLTVYILAFYGVHVANLLNLPTDQIWGTFGIGTIGGLYFFSILQVGGYVRDKI